MTKRKPKTQRFKATTDFKKVAQIFYKDDVFFKTLKDLDKRTPQEKLIDQRSQVYGDPTVNHKAIGYAFRGILQNAWQNLEVPPITPELVDLLLVSLKITRAAFTFHQDNYDDAHVYLAFAEERQKERQKEKVDDDIL